MSTTSPVSSAGATNGTGSVAAALNSASTPNAQNLQNQFLQLLTTQLKNQDPLNPVSSTDMVAQLAQISNLSATEQLNSNFSDLLMLNQLTQGANLVGDTVQYYNGNSGIAQGMVAAASVQNGQLLLNVNGQAVPLSEVISVSQNNTPKTS